MNDWKHGMMIAAAVLAGSALPAPLRAQATASAGSGFFAVAAAAAAGQATWKYSNPTAKDTISWSSGVNTVDGGKFGPFPFGPEPKFTIGPPLAGRAYAGFTNTDNGVNGSKAFTSGTGSGALVPGTIWGTNAVAKWTVNASGALGITFPGPWNYDATATGSDPLALQSSDLAALPGTTYNLFFAAGLSAGSFSPNGDIGLSLSYETASGIENLLNIKLDSGGASVTGDNPSNLTFYRLNSLDEGPTEIAANIMSLSQIKASLTADVLSDHALDTPLYLGVVLDHQAKPTGTLADGSVAKMHINSYAHDFASAAPVPEASTVVSFGLPLALGLVITVRRKKAASSRRSA